VFYMCISLLSTILYVYVYFVFFFVFFSGFSFVAFFLQYFILLVGSHTVLVGMLSQSIWYVCTHAGRCLLRRAELSAWCSTDCLLRRCWLHGRFTTWHHRPAADHYTRMLHCSTRAD